MSYQPPKSLQKLVTQLIDEIIDDKGMKRLDEILSRDINARTWYLEEMRMHSALHRWAASMESQPVGVDEVIRLEQKKVLKVATISAVAVLLLTIVVMKLFMVKEEPPLLTFTMTDRSQFTLTHDSQVDIPEGMAQLERGSRLQLSQGVIELTFNSGVKSVIMAPADITLHEEDELFIREGAAWFSVPPNAIGFQVRTDELDVVDLGTEFAVLSLPDDHDEVHVFKGKVEVSAKRIRRESAVLIAEDACRIDPVGRLTEIPARPLDFLTALPQKAPFPYLHWSFDSLVDNGFPASGSHPRIADGFVRSMVRPAADLQTEGCFGQAIYLDGQEDWLQSEWMGIADSQPRTLVVWYRFSENMESQFDVNGVSWGARLEDGQPNANAKFVVSGCSRFSKSSEEGLFAHMTFGETWCQGVTNLQDGKWHCVAVTYSGETLADGQPDLTIYVDGEEEELTWWNVSPLAVVETKVNGDSARFLNFGKTLRNNEEDTFFQGWIDEVYLFEGVLSAQQIRHLSRSNTISCQK